MKKLSSSQLKGFTLIEILISSVIALIIIGMTTSYFLSMLTGKQNYLVRQELEYNMQFALNEIQKELKQSTRVNISKSILDANPGLLDLSFSDGNKNPSIIGSDGSNLTLKQGEGDPLSLLSNTVQVQNLVFTYHQPNNSPGVIKGSLTLVSKINNSLSRSENFSISLRTNI